MNGSVQVIQIQGGIDRIRHREEGIENLFGVPVFATCGGYVLFLGLFLHAPVLQPLEAVRLGGGGFGCSPLLE